MDNAKIINTTVEKNKKGRPLKYITEEERRKNISKQKKEWDERNKEKRKKYYQENKEYMNKMRMEHHRNVMKIYNLYKNCYEQSINEIKT